MFPKWLSFPFSFPDEDKNEEESDGAHAYVFIEVFYGAWVIVIYTDWICNVVQGMKTYEKLNNREREQHKCHLGSVGEGLL